MEAAQQVTPVPPNLFTAKQIVAQVDKLVKETFEKQAFIDELENFLKRIIITLPWTLQAEEVDDLREIFADHGIRAEIFNKWTNEVYDDGCGFEYLDKFFRDRQFEVQFKKDGTWEIMQAVDDSEDESSISDNPIRDRLDGGGDMVSGSDKIVTAVKLLQENTSTLVAALTEATKTFSEAANTFTECMFGMTNSMEHLSRQIVERNTSPVIIEKPFAPAPPAPPGSFGGGLVEFHFERRERGREGERERER